MIAARLAEGPHAVHEGPAEQHEISAQSECPDDVQSGAHPAVEEDAGPTIDLPDDGRQRVDGGERTVELARAVVRNLDALHAGRYCPLRVIRVHDTLHDYRSVPEIANLTDIVPVERAAQFLADVTRHLAHLLRIGVFFDGPEPGQTGEQGLDRPGGMNQRFVHESGRDPRRRFQARAAGPFPPAAHGHVRRYRERMETGVHRALQQIITYFASPGRIELKPAHVADERSDRLGRLRGHCAQAVRKAVLRGRGGED